MGYTGHVEEVKKNQHYRLVVNIGKDPAAGTYKKKRKDVRCGGKREAETLLRNWIEELELPPAKKYSDMLIEEYMLYWVDTIAKPNLEQNTFESYRWEILHHINPGIGHGPLCELTPLHIQTLISYWLEAGRLNKPKNGKKKKNKEEDKKKEKPQGLSNRSVEYKYSILNQALKYAVKPLKLIEENPCEGIKIPRSKETQKEKIVVLSREELKKFLDGIANHQDYAETYVDSYTGMRISELLGLRWSDILWNKKAIRVEMTLHILKDGAIEHRPRLKNKKPRVIDVTDNVLAVLREHKKYLLSKGLLKNKYNMVFPDDRTGMPQDRKNLSKRFANIAAKMGHKGMRFHDLRHTHATILLEAGEMLNAVSERLGHLDVATTSRIYAHVRPSKARATANRFEELMNS